MSAIKNPEYTSVQTALENGKKQAKRGYDNQMMAAKQPAIVALQQNRITLEQYAELVGEAFSATMAAEYRRTVTAAAESVKLRVDSGLISPEEYERIVGEGAQ